MNIYSQKSNILIKIILSVIVFIILMLLILKNVYNIEEKENFSFQHTLLHKFVHSSILSINSKYVIELDRILNNRPLIYNLKKRNREVFSKLIDPIYKRLKENNPHIKILTFRDLDGKTFYRAHKPEFFGDIVSSKRKLILDTLKKQKKLFGFEVGKLSMAYRVATPIFYNGKLQGTIELGIHPKYLDDKVKELSELINISFLIYNKHNINIPDINKSNIIQDNLIFEKKVFFKKILQDKISLDNKNVFHKDNKKSYFLETDMYLLNHMQEEIGRILISWDVTKKIERHEILELKVGLLIFVMGLLALFYMNKIVKGFIMLIEKEVEKNRSKDIQILQQSRLAQMGEMLSMIAHQWRQPLTSISSAANSMTVKIMMDQYKKEFFEEKISDITGYAQHLSQTINDFRAFSLADTKLKESVTFEVIVNDVIKIVGTVLKSRGIELVTNYKYNKEINMYSNELKQVVLNFIKNSEDVLKEKKIENPKIIVDTSLVDNNYIFKISDNGGGIDEKVLSKIFDPYFTTKDKKNGTGLGLYMSKVIVEEHCGWKLNAYNNEEGAVFEIVVSLSG